MRYAFSVFLLLSTASIALAVPYELPTDNGWYQLQDIKTYETLCSTGSGLPCDVPPGDYVLINHNAAVGQPDRRISVQVGKQDDGPTIIYESKTCESITHTDNDIYVLRPFSEIGCTVQCTVGMVTGGSCSVVYTDHAETGEHLHNTQTKLSAEGFRCSLTSDPGERRPQLDVGGWHPARFYIGLACLN